MKNILIIAFIAIGFALSNVEPVEAQLFRDRPVAVGINWNAACAAESAVQFAICRQSGGSWFSCTVGAGLRYWQCSGSTFQTNYRRVHVLRASMVGRRVLRRSR